MKSDSMGIYYGRLFGGHKRVKERLVKAFGLCYWCRIEVKIYNHEEIKRQTRPGDEATLDHLKSKNKGRIKGEVTPKVLSCRKCNEARAREEIKKMKYKKIRYEPPTHR